MSNEFEHSPNDPRKPGAAPRTLIVGLGETGLATAKYLAALGEPIRVLDSRNDPPGLAALRAALPQVPVELGSLDLKWLAGASRVVWSPGLPSDLPLAVEARRRGLDVVGDIELFARAAIAPVIGVTGSNGKSTVTMLAARLLEAAGFNAPSGGNLGPPALTLLDAAASPGAQAPDYYVLELSSFQMETTESLRPLAAALLNVSSDHLDRHGDIERYAGLKAKLLSAADWAIYNHDDPHARRFGEHAARPVPFSVETPLERGWSIIEEVGARWLARDGRAVFAVDRLSLRGRHNEANALAALALAAVPIEASGDPARFDAALAELERFPGLPHRCRVVGTRRGVEYIDDSKGTNVGATIAALAGLPAPLVLIAGGLGKGADFTPLAAAARGRVKAAVLIGAAADELERVLVPVCPVLRASSMDEAVQLAADAASPGDTVLLSPACASQDMFRDYRHRGEVFAAAVEALPA